MSEKTDNYELEWKLAHLQADLDAEREEGREEGREIGREEGREECIFAVLDIISEYVGLTESAAIDLLKKRFDLPEEKAKEYYQKWLKRSRSNKLSWRFK